MIVTLEYLNEDRELVQYTKNIPGDSVAQIIQIMDEDEEE